MVQISYFLVLLALATVGANTVINPQPPTGNSVVPQSGNGKMPENGENQPAPEDAVYYYLLPKAPSKVTQQSNNALALPQSGYSQEVQTPHSFYDSPLLALTSNAGFNISAYISQIFWCFAAIAISFAIILFICQFFGFWGELEGVVKKFKERGGVGKSIDFDKLTNMVYDALDTYGKWAEKDVRMGEIPKMK